MAYLIRTSLPKAAQEGPPEMIERASPMSQGDDAVVLALSLSPNLHSSGPWNDGG